MNGFQKFLTATFMSAAMLFAPTAQAMPIQQFDKMGQAGGSYLADLVQAAEQSLKNSGRADDAAKVSQLFTERAPDGGGSVGVEQFYMILAIARVAAAKNPNAPPIEVSKVLAVCLEKNDGIKLPEEFKQLASNLDHKYAQKKDKEETRPK